MPVVTSTRFVLHTLRGGYRKELMQVPGRNQVHADGRWPRRLAALPLLLALALPVPGAVARDTLVMAGDSGYPPFQMLDEGEEPTGFDVELLRLIARDLDLELQVELGDWERALARLERREVDVVPMFVSARRDDRFLFTRPYLLRYHAVFGRKGQAEVASLEGLKGHSVAVQDQGLGWEELRQLQPMPALVVVPTEPAALHAVAGGLADYALVPTGIGLHAINEDGLRELVPLGPSLLEQSYALAVRRDRPDLVTALDGALVRVRESGKQDRLYHQWLGQIGAAPQPRPRLAWAWWLLPVALLAAWLAWRRARRQAPSPESERLLADLRAALADGSLGYAIQPKLDLRSGRLHGGEMLVRWNHPEHGLLSPDAFIPLAESAGETAALTLYMVRRAAEELARWPPLSRQPALAVNVGANDLGEESVVDAILGVIGDRGHALILEVTETDLMHAPDRVADALPRLRRQGIRISLDDFGTGHATLTHLRRLAPEELKIDGSFVTGLLASRSDRAIVKGILQIAHEVGALVAAEGIEGEETLQWLREAGCDVAQGYAISPPLPPAEFAAMLAGRAST